MRYILFTAATCLFTAIIAYNDNWLLLGIFIIFGIIYSNCPFKNEQDKTNKR